MSFHFVLCSVFLQISYLLINQSFRMGTLLVTKNAYLSSSSSGRAISTDISDPLSPPLPIIHCFQEVFRATSRIYSELLYVGSSWSSCLYTSTWRGPQEYITYERVPTSSAVSCMSGSSNFDSFHDGRKVAVQLLLCWVLPPGLFQYCSQYSCIVAVKLFLHPFS